MVVSTKEFLQDLLEITRENLNKAESFKLLSEEVLNRKQDSESWSVFECIEHLNRYGDFYIPEIDKRIEHSTYKPNAHFKSNWLGRYLSKSVSYEQEGLKKMKTFKSMNPVNSKLTIETLDKFIEQQHQIIDLLDRAKTINLDKTKTAISISKLIKLKLGDTFRVVIYHNKRHIIQAEKNIDLIMG